MIKYLIGILICSSSFAAPAPVDYTPPVHYSIDVVTDSSKVISSENTSDKKKKTSVPKWKILLFALLVPIITIALYGILIFGKPKE